MNKKKIFLALGLVVAVAAGLLAFGGNSSLFKGALNVSGTGGTFLIEEEGIDRIAEGEDGTIVLRRSETFQGDRYVYVSFNNRYSAAERNTDFEASARFDTQSVKINRWEYFDEARETIVINISALNDTLREGEEELVFYIYEKADGRNKRLGTYSLTIDDVREWEANENNCFNLYSMYTDEEIAADEELSARDEECRDAGYADFFPTYEQCEKLRDEVSNITAQLPYLSDTMEECSVRYDGIIGSHGSNKAILSPRQCSELEEAHGDSGDASVEFYLEECRRTRNNR